MKLPFGWMPGHWGLKGKTREIARVEYEMPDGFEKSEKLIELSVLDPNARQTMLLDLKLEHGHITMYDYEVALANLSITDETALSLRLLSIDRKYEKITETEFQKKNASINKTPWVDVVRLDINSEDVDQGALELDWNDEFISELRAKGYKGKTEEEIVDQWLGTLCKYIAIEQFGGVGNFDDLMGNDQNVRNRAPNNTGKREVK